MAMVTVREACRRRMPLDGVDAQALEHALTITEGERDRAREALEAVSEDRDTQVKAASGFSADAYNLRQELMQVTDQLTRMLAHAKERLERMNCL